jgi:hypothetical protein
MKLSACLLARNDARLIGAAIRSLHGVAEEVVVADMNSTDDSAAIAREGGAIVRPFQWTEDFSAARHFLVEQARGQWILWMNPNEELSPESRGALEIALARDDVAAYFVRIRQAQSIETGDIRLWRRARYLKFEGRLHPHLAPSFKESIEREGKTVTGSEIVLIARDEHGGPLTQEKLRFNVRLLELELRDRPGQLHYLIELGLTLLHLRDARGNEVLEQAAQQVLEHRDSASPPVWNVQALLEFLVRNPDSPVRGVMPIDAVLALALRWFGRSPGLLYASAEHLFRAGDAARSAQLLEQLIHLGQTQSYDRTRAFHAGFIGEDAMMNLAACYRRLGRGADAAECYRRLLSSARFGKRAGEELAAMNQPQGP